MDPDVLQIRCPKCGGYLTAQCGPKDDAAGLQAVTCLFCGHVEQWDLGARLLWVTAGHAPPAMA